MDNALIKYSLKAASTIKAVIHDADIPTLIADHPFIYFGTTFAITYLIAKKSGILDEIWWAQFEYFHKEAAVKAYQESHELRRQWQFHDHKLPEPIKLDHIHENPFRGEVHFEEISLDPNIFMNNPEYDVIYVSEDWANYIYHTCDTAATFMVHYPWGRAMLRGPFEVGLTPIILEKLCNTDIVINKSLRSWETYGGMMQDCVFEAKRPLAEIYWFFEDYIDNFIVKIPIRGTEAYNLVVHKYNFSKFMDLYYGLGINKLKNPPIHQWLIEPWNDALYEKFLLFRKSYRGSFKAFTGLHYDPSITAPENAALFKAHQIAFKKMWLDIASSMPPELLAVDVTLVDRMVTYAHYAKYMTFVC